MSNCKLKLTLIEGLDAILIEGLDVMNNERLVRCIAAVCGDSSSTVGYT